MTRTPETPENTESQIKGINFLDYSEKFKSTLKSTLKTALIEYQKMPITMRETRLFVLLEISVLPGFPANEINVWNAFVEGHKKEIITGTFTRTKVNQELFGIFMTDLNSLYGSLDKQAGSFSSNTQDAVNGNSLNIAKIIP